MSDLHDFFEERTEFHDEDSHEYAQDSYDHDNPNDSPMSYETRGVSRHGAARGKSFISRLLLTIVIIGLIAAVAIAGTHYVGRWVRNNLISSQSEGGDYPGPGDGEVTFVVSSGQGAYDIALNLVQQDIIKSASAFTQLVAANDTILYPGTYHLKYHMSASSVLAILSDQTQATGFLEVLPGERLSDVIASAQALDTFDSESFVSIINSGGSGILPSEAQGHFEGWLEPGTYVVEGRSAQEVLQEMVNNRIAKLDELGVPSGQERERILIMASIAEAEVNSTEYYGMVARVILNRLANNMVLGMDSTVAYGIGVSASQLTNAQLADDSNLYNTRIYLGLPPSPISNPGDNAIAAALNPPAGNWLYFVTVNLQTGETKFVATEEEFWQIRQEYKDNNPEGN